MALNFKVGGGIDQRATRVAHRVRISYIHVAAQAGTQQRVESAVYGNNMVALPRLPAQQIHARHDGRAAHH